ncbi:hypothetical protein [Bifidobacterium cuniculi]|uniref:Peptidoglycan-binding domain 1 protein n=1 Tax=Bifidobacterium cuniculi TaxID=1688 RepID=A0A087AT35_9BIFI|nr:hypothetical protein [Bifidobacterium cuniculi]KFI61935.1 Peptidoglycan-binding domain 1 protein [Bifidobacterium cuniculi]
MHKRTRTATDDRPGVATSIVVLLVVLALAVGAAATLLAVRITTPRDLSSTAQGGTIATESGTYDDRRAVTVRVTQGDDATLRSPAEGTLTAYDCAVGATVESGTSMLAVDDTPVLSLHTNTPLYRALTSGVQGADVAALHAELRTLGYDAPDSDTFSWQSVEAFNALAEQVGSVKPTADNGWSVTPQMLMWLPARTVTVAGCPARTGMHVDAATDVVATAPLLTGATIIRTTDARSDQPAAGLRSLTVAGQTFDIAQDTVDMTDRAFLNAVAASSEYAAAMSDTQQSGTGAAQPAADGTVDVTYQWTLKEPLQVTFVPPAALYDVASGTGCLSVAGTPTPVDIVASQLGRTMVTSAQPIGSVDVPPATTKACR